MSSGISLQRNEISPDYSKLYKSLGSLIKEYRQWRGISQEMLAESIQISVRELQNWEADRRCSRIENLHDLSEFTGIPMQALVVLNTDQPVWYCLRKRLFSYSSMEKDLFSSQEFFRHREKSTDDALIHIKPISEYRHIDRILSCHRDIYGKEIPLGRDVIEAAAIILPDLNIVALDCWGHYVGHQVCLPIRMDMYEEVKRQKNNYIRITAKSIKDISNLRKIVIFHYSSFFANASVAYRKFLYCTQNLVQHENVNKYVIALYPATKESRQLVSNLGWNPAENLKNKNSEICPTIYESKWDDIAVTTGTLGWKFEHSDTQTLADDPASAASIEVFPAISAQETNNVSQAAKKTFAKEMPGYKFPVSVGKLPPCVGKTKPDNQNMKMQAVKSEMEACKNPKCTLYRKIRKGNIISNGTYQTKEGAVGRRFYCNKCGKYFCSRTGTIFYGLRSPEEKVFRALKLLAKGMSTQTVAKYLGVKHDTVRHWIEAVAGQSEKIDTMLKECNVSPSELAVLWTFVKKNALLKRTALYNRQNNKGISIL